MIRHSTARPFAGQGHNSVWYRCTAPATGTMTVNTMGSDFDTVLAIWTGSRGNLQLQGCNDDAGGALQSEVSIPVSAGTTYHIEVAGYSGGGALNIAVNSTAGGGATSTPTATATTSGDATFTPTPSATPSPTPTTMPGSGHKVYLPVSVCQGPACN